MTRTTRRTAAAVLLAAVIAVLVARDAGGQEVASIKTGLSVQSVAWTADGKGLVTSGILAGAVKVFDAATGAEVAAYAPGKDAVGAAAVSADGRILAAGTGRFRSAKVWVWNLADGKPLATFTSKLEKIGAVAVSADGTRVAAAGGTVKGGSTIEVWAVGDTAAAPQLLAGHPSVVKALAFSPDGTRLASGGFDKVTRLWTLSTGDGSVVGPELASYVNHVVFSPDGRWLVTINSGSASAKTGPVTFYNLKTRAVETVLKGEVGAVHHVAFTRDGKTAATVDSRGATLWNLATGKEVVTYRGASSAMVAAFSPDDRLVACGAQSHVIKVWPADPKGVTALAGPTDPTKLMGHTAPVRAVAYSADGKLLASCSDDLTLKLWDPATGKELRSVAVLRPAVAKTPAPKVPPKAPAKLPPDPPAQYFDAVVDLSLSPDGKYAAVTAAKEVKVFTTADGALVATLKEHTDQVAQVAYSPTGKTLVSTDKTGAMLWNAATKKLITHVPHVYQPTAAFTPDGTQLLTASGVRTATSDMQLTDAITGKALGFRLDGQTGFLKIGVLNGFSLAFAPNGKSVLITDRLYDWATAREQAKLASGGTSQGQLVRFSPDGRHLAGAKNDGVAIWDAATGREVAAVELKGLRLAKVRHINVAWSPDGKTLAVTGPGQTAADAARTPVVGGTQTPTVDWSIKLVDVKRWVE